MKKLYPTTIIIGLFIFNIANGQVAQFPQVYYNGQGAGGSSLYVHSSASIASSNITSLSTSSKIGADNFATSTEANGTATWARVCLPSSTSGIKYGYMMYGSYYVRINEMNNYATITATNLNIRPSAGSTLWVTIAGSNAMYGQNSIVALTGNTSVVSGTTWYEVYLTTDCSQAMGWLSGSFLTVNSNTTNYFNIAGSVMNNSSQYTWGATITIGSWSTNSTEGFYQYKLSPNWSGNITCSHPSYNTSSPASYSYTASSHTYSKNFVLSNSCTYSISTSSVSPSSSSGSSSVSVAATSGCSWTAVSNNTSWLTVTSGSSGTGNGTVNYSYTSNPNSTSRTGTITIAGSTFTVTQTGTTTPASVISLSGDLSFGSVQISNTSQKTLTITNTGTATLTVSSISYPAGFSGNWGGGNISASGSQNVTVTFSPTSATSYGGTITVNSNASSGTSTIACSGTVTTVSTYSISGNVINPSISDLTGNIQNNPINCNIKIFDAGTSNQVGSVTASGGNFTFTGIQNQNYDLLASYTSNSTAYTVKKLNIAANTSNVKLIISAGLIEEIGKYNDTLSHLSCKLDDLVSNNTFSLNSYNMSSSYSFIEAKKQIVNNQDQVIEALERLCMAERVLVKYFNQAATMNNELVLSLSEFANFIVDMVELSDCDGLFGYFIDYLKETIETPIDNSNLPYKSYYHATIDVIADHIQGSRISMGTIYNDDLKEPVDMIITNNNLNDVYISNTSKIVYNSVSSAQNGNYSGNLQNTVTNLLSKLQTSQKITIGAQSDAHSFREQLGWVKFITDVSNTAMSTTCFSNVYLDLLGLGLDTWHFVSLGTSIYKSVNRENELVFEANQTTPNAFLKSAGNQWNNFNSKLQENKLQSTNTFTTNFENEYTSTLLDINSNKISSFNAHLNNLIKLNKELNDNVIDELNSIKAAIPFSNITDSMYINDLKYTLFTSPFVRYSHLATISKYIQTLNDTLKNSLNNHKPDLLDVDNLMLNELGNVESKLSSVSTPAYIAVSKSNIPLIMSPNSDSTITIKFKNYGATSASNLYVKIRFDNLFTSLPDSIFIGNLGINQERSIAFTLHSPSPDNHSSYTILFFANNAIAIPKGGTIYSKTPTITSSEQFLIDKGNIKITPNPSNGKITITMPEMIPNSTIKIYNTLGEIIYQSIIHNSRSEIDLENFPSGIYLIQVKASEKTFVQKIIIQ